MIINELQISNFRCFSRATLRIAPITLITGANSAGKSSLFAPLLAAAQTDGMPAMLSPNGRYIDMGDYLDIVYRHRSKGVLGITITGTDDDEQTTIDTAFAYDTDAQSHRLQTLSVASNYYNLRVEKLDDEYDLHYSVMPKESKFLKRLRDNAAMTAFYEAVSAMMVSAFEGKRKEQATRQFPSPRGIPEDGRVTGTVRFSKPQDFFEVFNIDDGLAHCFVGTDLQTQLRTFQAGFSHLSSFRLAPERTYYEIAKADLRIGRYGENYVEQISQWQSDDAQEIGQLRKDLRTLRVLVDLKTRRLKGGRIELVGRPKKSSTLANLADLGFGTSQLLPILVAVNQLQPAATFTVSQPETHLHPEVQAQLANYFVGVAKERNASIIVETHSEYLINRLRLLIAEGVIGEDDVSMVYVANTGHESTVCPIGLLADGRIMGAPPEFFETYMMDVMKLAMGGDS